MPSTPACTLYPWDMSRIASAQAKNINTDLSHIAYFIIQAPDEGTPTWQRKVSLRHLHVDRQGVYPEDPALVLGRGCLGHLWPLGDGADVGGGGRPVALAPQQVQKRCPEAPPHHAVDHKVDAEKVKRNLLLIGCVIIWRDTGNLIKFLFAVSLFLVSSINIVVLTFGE